MHKGFVVIRVAPGEWLEAILPGLQARADRGSVVQITPDRVVIDRRRENLYDKRGARGAGGGKYDPLGARSN